MDNRNISTLAENKKSEAARKNPIRNAIQLNFRSGVEVIEDYISEVW